MPDSANKPLYPRTDEEWREYCAEAKRILIANSLNRKEGKVDA
jgi:hypothetical protein